MTDPTDGALLRPHAEQQYAAELAALAAADDRPRPANWRLSPWAVVTYLLGGTLADGTVITPKYVGSRRLIEIAVATLATDRALLLLGVPGTAKTWVSEHLAAAISGDSTLLVQGTAGTAEEAVRYGWNYARLLADGPSFDGAGAQPGDGRRCSAAQIARVEELTRMPSDVQDALITVLSEKTLPVARARQRGAGAPGLQRHRHRQRPRPRRQRAVQRAAPAVQHRGAARCPTASRTRWTSSPAASPSSAAPSSCPGPTTPPTRSAGWSRSSASCGTGQTVDGRTTVKSPTGTLSTAEAISVVTSGLALAAHFGDGVLRAADVAGGIIGAVVKDPVSDQVVWKEYLETVVRERADWTRLLPCRREVSQ